MLDPIFLAPKSAIFFAKSRWHLGPNSRETIFREINSGLPVNAGWNTCCAMVNQARLSIDTSIVLQSRVRLIQCQCRSRLQIANLGINNAFLMNGWPRCLHPPYCPDMDSSAANQELVIGRYFGVPLAVYAHQNKGYNHDAKRFKIRPQIGEMTATLGSSDSINTYFIQKALACHPNFRKCTMTVEYIAVFTGCNFGLWWKQDGG